MDGSWRSSGSTGDPAARAMGRRRERIRTATPTARIYPRFGGSMADEDPVLGDVIYSYTRKQAIEDGVLVDITEMAKDAGIKYPVAITSTAFFGYVAPDPMPPGQDLKGRLWDLFTMFRLAAKRSEGPNLEFNIQFVLGGIRVGPAERPVKTIVGSWHIVEVTLQAVCGPGDDPAPVVTIMLTDES